jgi:hypothetical protein
MDADLQPIIARCAPQILKSRTGPREVPSIIEDQQDAATVADIANALEVSGRRFHRAQRRAHHGAM